MWSLELNTLIRCPQRRPRARRHVGPRAHPSLFRSLRLRVSFLFPSLHAAAPAGPSSASSRLARPLPRPPALHRLRRPSGPPGWSQRPRRSPKRSSPIPHPMREIAAEATKHADLLTGQTKHVASDLLVPVIPSIPSLSPIPFATATEPDAAELERYGISEDHRHRHARSSKLSIDSASNPRIL
jgi:hypothetical protein